MNTDFTNKVVLTEKTVLVKELKVKHLKTLYKSLIGDIVDPENIFLNIKTILFHLTDLSKKEIDNLNFLDYFILLFEIRSTSIGNIIFIESPDQHNTKIEVNIYKFIDIIRTINLQKLLTTEIYNNVKIFYKLPRLLDLLQINNETTLSAVYNFFIKKIEIENHTIDFTTISVTEKKDLLEKIPAKITSHIIKKVQQILKNFDQINLLSTTFGLNDKFLYFNINIQNLALLVKLLFGNQLLSLYENIFALCKLGNLTPEYIENCTPGEYLLFVKKLEAFNKQNNNNSVNFDETASYNVDNLTT